MKYIKTIIISLVSFVLPLGAFAAVPVTQVVNGGTGSTTLTGILLGNGTSQVRTTTIGSGLSLIGTTLSATGASFSYPFTVTTNYATTVSATSTPIWGMVGLYASSTSYFTNLIASQSTTTQATSTNQFSSILTATTGTITNLNFTLGTGTSATTTNLAVSNVGNALYLGNSTGGATPYAGTSCTNQFVRSLSGVGGATCATVGSADVSLANLTATDSTLTFSGTYNGSTARTIGINLANPNTWTGGQTFGNATATSATTTNLTVSANHIIVGNQNGYVNATSSGAFNIASTTNDAMGKNFSVGTTTLLVANFPWPITLIGFYCTASTTGTALVRITHDNGNATETSTCTSGGFTRTLTNNTFTQYEAFNIQASSTAGTVNRITVTPAFIKTGE